MPPSFFHVFFNHFSFNIMIPFGFAKEHMIEDMNMMIPPLLFHLETKSAGRRCGRWDVNIQQLHNDLYLTDGWSAFVNHNNIRMGQFLVFYLIRESTFHVALYRPNGCLKDPFSAQTCGPSGTKGFSAIINKHNRHFMHVPKAFALETGIATKSSIILEDEQGTEWTVGIDSNRREDYNRICIASGWNDVQVANGLVMGSECWFGFNESSGNLVVKKQLRKHEVMMPSFFKALSKDDYTRKLRLPIDFVHMYGKILSKRSRLVTSSGETWGVNLELVEDEYCFTRGWDQFVEDLELGRGEYLVFTCINVDKSEFRVTVYGICGCELEFPSKNFPIGHDEDDDHNYDTAAAADDDHDYDDDDDDADDDDDYDEEEAVEGVHNHTSFEFRRTNTAFTGSRRSSTEKGTNNGHTSEEEHPRFILRLERHQASRLSLVHEDFAMAAGLTTMTTVVLQYPPSERCWPVLLDHFPNLSRFRLDFCEGWSEFREGNGLVFGNTYLFEYIESKNVIQVKLIIVE